MAYLRSDTRWAIEASTQGARWLVVRGMTSQAAAERVLTSIVDKDGLRAADATGHMIAVTFAVVEEPR